MGLYLGGDSFHSAQVIQTDIQILINKEYFESWLKTYEDFLPDIKMLSPK